MKIEESKFPLGQTVITPGALDSLNPTDLLRCMKRHSTGDWGECGQEDWQENELSLKEGFRILSVFHDRDGTKFWIITEADRSATTILLPSEY